jgi:hypothetical protein
MSDVARVRSAISRVMCPERRLVGIALQDGSVRSLATLAKEVDLVDAPDDPLHTHGQTRGGTLDRIAHEAIHRDMMHDVSCANWNPRPCSKLRDAREPSRRVVDEMTRCRFHEALAPM